MKGLFLTFEGTEASGKSTQIALLAERLRGLHLTVHTTREPGGTALGEEIRHILKHSATGSLMSPMTELLLMNASRAQLVSEIITPALERGEIVLCDRFFDSSVAYQGYGRGLDLALVRNVIAAAVGDLRPDLTLLMAVPVGVSEHRRGLREAAQGAPQDRFEKSEREFFERVEQGYAAVAKAEPARIKMVDGSGSQKAVTRAIWERVEPMVIARFGLGSKSDAEIP